MSVASISRFLHGIRAMGVAVFGQDLSQTDWHILLALGRCVADASEDPPSGLSGAQSYKCIKYMSGLSDDALSRGLRRLVELGLVERHVTESDQRVIRYSLSSRARRAVVRIGRLVLAELASLILSITEDIPDESREEFPVSAVGAD